MSDLKEELQKIYYIFINMTYEEQMDFALSLNNPAECDFFANLADELLGERFVKNVKEGIF
ncbi:MAG: hypothetical protein PUB10_05535 [Clostridiales bacterium]|nr:hypothetical protein [Clostridiales bacterium]